MKNLVKHWNIRQKKGSYILFIISFFVLSIMSFHSIVVPKKMLICLFVIGLMLITFKPKKLAAATSMIIIVTGLLSSFLSPVNDIPDETAHYYRSVFVSEGDVNLSNDLENLKVSEDAQKVQSKNKTLIINSPLNNEKHQSKEKVAPEVTITNVYSFVSYLPQAIGIAIGNTLNISVMFSYWLGRFFNVLVYALLCYLAVKVSSKAEQLIAVSALLPMNVYLSASYNQDGMTLGVILLVIALFCNFICSDRKVTLTKFICYTFLCILLSTMKFPFILLIALPFFLPSERFTFQKNSWLVKLLCITSVFIVAVIWLKLSSEVQNRSLEALDHIKDVNPKEQIVSMLHSPIKYTAIILREILYRLIKPENMNLFGWLTYGPTFLIGLNMMFYFLVVVNNIGKVILDRWSKILLFLVITGIASGIVLAMYITWTPVGLLSVMGVQDRYFLGVIPLMLIFFTSNCSKLEKCQDVVSASLLLDISICFIYAMLLSTLFTYYAW
ncbi:DUF2142 domain-containing protein [Streptococcus respiraculi]|uniref:DUF2142 domain-containing protein n=1 Tax=Streptococcus respiraculi TaxID=2021971 RepID=UPI000E70DF10|nr:DUF2142 domain-containing protein [Streptococcus respiraculi]